MTDDEVKQWLDKHERWEFERALLHALREREEMKGRTYVHGPWESTAQMARALAATRKALAAMEWASGHDEQWCKLCHVDWRDPSTKHMPDCIFATMPRPK